MYQVSFPHRGFSSLFSSYRKYSTYTHTNPLFRFLTVLLTPSWYDDASLITLNLLNYTVIMYAEAFSAWRLLFISFLNFKNEYAHAIL